MIPPPIEHRFTIDGEHYCLVEWTRGSERRLRQDYALALSLAPGVIDAIDGADLYAEAVSRECLKEAPALWWEDQPAAPQNGKPRKVMTFDRVPRALWEVYRKELDAFLGKLFPVLPAPSENAPPAVPADAPRVAPAQDLPPVFSGRAE